MNKSTSLARVGHISSLVTDNPSLVLELQIEFQFKNVESAHGRKKNPQSKDETFSTTTQNYALKFKVKTKT